MNKQQRNGGNGIIRLLPNMRRTPRDEAIGDLVSDCRALFGEGATVIVPGWDHVCQGLVSELQLPDGEPMTVFLSRPLQEGEGLLIVPDGEGTFDCRLAIPARDSNGQLIAFTPTEDPVMVIPDTDDDDDDD